MADDDRFVIECADCGQSYRPGDKVAEDHDEDCPVYDALVKRGQTREDHE